MTPRPQPPVAVNDRVRLYDEYEDWFHPGKIVEICHRQGHVDVDYGDWVQRYEIADLRVCWPEDGTYERCLVPLTKGETIEDYREEDQTVFA